MARDLTLASIKMHGPYNNGNGTERPNYAHDVVTRRPVLEELGQQEPVQALAGRLATAHAAMLEPSEDLKARIIEADPSIQFTGRWGYNGMGAVAKRVLEVAFLPPHFVADLATAEIDATWAMNAEPGDITAHATSIVRARAIAGHFHRIDLWALNSD
jgi:hypothetical protein